MTPTTGVSRRPTAGSTRGPCRLRPKTARRWWPLAATAASTRPSSGAARAEPGMGVGSLLEEGAERDGERAAALVHGEQTLSYADLDRCVGELAGRLGAVAGQRVAI